MAVILLIVTTVVLAWATFIWWRHPPSDQALLRLFRHERSKFDAVVNVLKNEAHGVKISGGHIELISITGQRLPESDLTGFLHSRGCDIDLDSLQTHEIVTTIEPPYMTVFVIYGWFNTSKGLCHAEQGLPLNAKSVPGYSYVDIGDGWYIFSWEVRDH
jgi:hypothetical protein